MTESGRWLPFLASFPASAIVRFVGMTNRIQYTGSDYQTLLREKKGPFIFSLWHSRALFPLNYFGKLGVSVLVSQSKDGEYIAQLLKRHRVHPMRGSTSRDGSQGLLGLLHWLKRGHSVAIPPDGPRGPREIVQPGIIHLARLSGIPIIPASFHCTRHMRLNSWDRFVVPLPFGTTHIVSGDPIVIPRDLNRDGVETKRLQLEKTMHQVTHTAEDLIRPSVE